MKRSVHNAVFRCEMDYLPYHHLHSLSAQSTSSLCKSTMDPTDLRWLLREIAKHIVICNHILGRQSLPISGLPDSGVMETQMRDSVDLDSPTSD